MVSVDDIIFLIIQILLEGVVFGLILSKAQEWYFSKKELREITFVMSKFHELLVAKETLDIYYFVKLLTDDERTYLKRVLFMEARFYDRKSSSGSVQEDVLEMRNSKFIFVVDPQMANFHRIKNMKMENTFSFQQPEENVEVYESFKKYVKEMCEDFGVSLS